MKGQAKRFVDHKGESYDMDQLDKSEEIATETKEQESIGFLQLWRYATVTERVLTCIGVVVSFGCSFALIGGVVLYGELTALFVERERANDITGKVALLPVFKGGRVVPGNNTTVHKMALDEDSRAYGASMGVVMAMQLFCAAISVTLANVAAASMTNRLRKQLLRSVITQEIAFFDTNTSLNFASALTEDIEKLKAGVGEHVVMTTYLIGSVICGAGLSLSYGWQLTLVGLAIVPLAVAVATTVSKYQTRCSTDEVAAYGSAGRIVEEALASIRTVRAYGGEDLEVTRYTEALGPAASLSRRRGLWASSGSGLGWLLTYSLNAIVFGYGAELCINDLDKPPQEQMYHPGIMVTILFCTFMALQNIAMLGPHLEVFAGAQGAAFNLFKLLERSSKIDALQDAGERPISFKGNIVFDNIYFNYPSRPDVKVLRGLNLSINAGETVALVGSSGCGKSTILQLLQRMYEPDSGTITVDGYQLTDLNLHNYRTSIGVVGQEPVLFSGTIRDNITLGLDNVTERDLIEASQLAHAHQFITKLAQGYDTVLGERGAQLSGGQKQRIAIARAVLRKPALLLLDEPTSALDPAAERLVQAALDDASKGRTTLVVSHRLSTIVNASRIVYMEQGAALEQGTHLELLEKKGLYWKLVQEDLTSKSVLTLQQAEPDTDEDDDAVKAIKPQLRNTLRRSTRRSRANLTRDSMIRGSRRLGGAVASVHMVAAQTPDPLIADEEPEEAEEEPPASTIALLRLNAPEWPLLVGGGIASFIIGTTMPIFALLFSKLYGMFALEDKDEIRAQSQLCAGLFALVALICGLVTFLQAWLFNLAGAKLTDRLREITFRNFLKQEQGWYDETQNSVGALCARISSDCAAVQGATGTRLGTMLQGTSTMVLGILMSLGFQWKMTLVSLISVPCVIGGIYMEGWMTRRAEILERAALEQASRIATEAVLNVRTVQSLGVEKTILERYTAALTEAATRARRVFYVRGPVYGLCMCAPALGYTVSLAYGGTLIASENVPYPNVILVSEALIYGAWMLAEALSFAPSFNAARRAGARILKALHRQPSIVTEETAVYDPDWHAKGHVSYSLVHFRYPTRPQVPVLRGLSLKLEAGKSLALVGGSGCGKSTLMHILLRSYDPDIGSVAIDDRDIKRTLTLPQLRAQLGLVQQEPSLFARTIRENIAYGDNNREVPIDEIMNAAKCSNIHSFIMSLPQGYDTVLGSGGASMSGGQKQRVAIARALVRNPRVLLLDEATSALDAASEKTVQAALEVAAKDRTTIIIAHRLATIQHVDTICVIDKGVVAEQGSHQELVAKRGLYYELLQQQAPTTAL
ncbi:multidrug resistance protein homolog 49-like [Hyposmocoma kahamanoa]|uniref:multidrug resistance protein homolog 49-like n=1 Tax=Hyposmocoma kahamanoa TaxID=1477025 RepID=UPI000E6D68A4|nr:multidrug resistance protein homolog 49-like [Hyposmocoma kahamanoa]